MGGRKTAWDVEAGRWMCTGPGEAEWMTTGRGGSCDWTGAGGRGGGNGRGKK